MLPNLAPPLPFWYQLFRVALTLDKAVPQSRQHLLHGVVGACVASLAFGVGIEVDELLEALLRYFAYTIATGPGHECPVTAPVHVTGVFGDSVVLELGDPLVFFYWWQHLI